MLSNHSHLLTIDNEPERVLVTDIIDDYRDETRMAYNGSVYRYYRLAEFIWIDGSRQGRCDRNSEGDDETLISIFSQLTTALSCGRMAENPFPSISGVRTWS